jgi:hypothetical protein
MYFFKKTEKFTGPNWSWAGGQVLIMWAVATLYPF